MLKLPFKAAVFTAPYFLLVSQNTYFIQRTTYQVMGEYHGSRERWKNVFSSTHVLAMTGTPLPYSQQTQA